MRLRVWWRAFGWWRRARFFNVAEFRHAEESARLVVLRLKPAEALLRRVSQCTEQKPAPNHHERDEQHEEKQDRQPLPLFTPTAGTQILRLRVSDWRDDGRLCARRRRRAGRELITSLRHAGHVGRAVEANRLDVFGHAFSETMPARTAKAHPVHNRHAATRTRLRVRAAGGLSFGSLSFEFHKVFPVPRLEWLTLLGASGDVWLHELYANSPTPVAHSYACGINFYIQKTTAQTAARQS
jgi:hypothetical protein